MITIAVALTSSLRFKNFQTDRVEWLKKDSSEVRTIDSSDLDFRDLEPIGQSIGSSRVVMLGEETHGDGATFEAKVRLVKYLHEKMGFNILSFEAGIFSCRLVDAALQAGLPSDVAAAKGIFAVWSNSKQALPVFDYVRETKKTTRPMTITGFDFSLTSLESFLAFPKFATEFFDRTTALSPMERKQWSTQADRVLEEKVDAAARQKDVDLVGRMIAATQGKDPMMLARTSARERDFMRQQLVNYQKLLTLASVKPDTNKRKRNYPAINLRDKAMGENVAWLANRYYAGEKIIVWAHSYHTMRNAHELKKLDGTDSSGLFTMGTYVDRLLGKDAYSIAFLASEGVYGRVGEGEGRIATPPPTSLDGLLSAVGKPYLFLDLKGQPADSWLRQPFVARPQDYEQNIAVWPRIYDAFFYTRVMTRSHPFKSAR